MVSLGEGKNGRCANIYFLVVLCGSVFNDILERSFLAALDVVASMVYLKVKYYSSDDSPIIIAVDLSYTHHIQKAII